VHSQCALECMFSANGEELERVEVFKYLGWLISHDDADNQAMQSSLRRACGCWAWVSRVLWDENVTPKTCGMFYKATVQAMLLDGSGTWSLSPLSMKRLEGFHILCGKCQAIGLYGRRMGPGRTHAWRMCFRQSV
jgi:hypothetical protein